MNIYLDESKRKKLADIFDADPVKHGDMPCEECIACSACDGGCIANNYMQTGKFNTCSHAFCVNERQHYKVACYIIDSLADNETFIKFSKNRTSSDNKRNNTSNNNISNKTTNNNKCPSCGWCQDCQTYLRFKTQDSEGNTIIVKQ